MLEIVRVNRHNSPTNPPAMVAELVDTLALQSESEMYTGCGILFTDSTFNNEAQLIEFTSSSSFNQSIWIGDTLYYLPGLQSKFFWNETVVPQTPAKGEKGEKGDLNEKGVQGTDGTTTRSFSKNIIGVGCV